MKNKWILETAAQLIAEQSASGQSKQDFCLQRKINPATFYYWQKRLRDKENSSAGFTAIKVAISKKVEIQLRSGHWVALRSEDVDTLAQLVLAIGEANA